LRTVSYLAPPTRKHKPFQGHDKYRAVRESIISVYAGSTKHSKGMVNTGLAVSQYYQSMQGAPSIPKNGKYRLAVRWEINNMTMCREHQAIQSYCKYRADIEIRNK